MHNGKRKIQRIDEWGFWKEKQNNGIICDF